MKYDIKMGLENKEIFVKIFAFVSAILVMLTGVLNIVYVDTYTSTLVCFYLIMFAMIIGLTEVSPYTLENFILIVFPFLKGHIGRGVFYGIVGTFCFGEEMNRIGKIAGAVMLISGIATIVYFGIWAKR
jgi:hypothetical protein